MKIVILSDDFPPISFGGAGIIAYNQARGFSCDHEVTVITTSTDRNQIGIHKDTQGFTVVTLYARGSERWRAYRSVYNWSLVRKVKYHLSQIQPDVVHAHNIHTYLSYGCLAIARQCSSKVFLAAHDAMMVTYGKVFPDKYGNFSAPSFWQNLRNEKFRFNPFRNILIKYFLRSVDQIFVVSNALKDFLSLSGLKRMTVIHNGVDVSDWKVTNEKVVHFQDIYHLSNRRVIMFGGRISGAKGAFVALEVLKQVTKSVPEVMMLVVGQQGVLLEKFKVEAKKLGLDNYITYTGWISRKEMPAVYAVSDLVLVPSLYLDPFPTVVLEAMASSRPVVGTCFGGAQEAIKDGVTGFVVNPLTSTLVSDKITMLLKNKELALQYGQKAFEVIQDKFSLKGQLDALMDWYGKI